MRLSELAEAPVLSVDGTDLGTVGEVLFHPQGARVVGLSVRPRRAAGVLPRADRYVPLAQCRIERTVVVIDGRKLPSVEKSERQLGLSWDETVQWRGMPVAAVSGDAIGSVADVVFDWRTGAVETLEISSGVLADVSIGKLSAPASAIGGFRDGAVRLTCEYKDLSASGGVAKVAAAGAAVAKDKGSKVAKQAYDAGMSAAISIGRSLKHGRGKQVLDAVRKAVSDVTREDG
jgi:sporulation protein YlmC with PRC-barrel domain